MKHIGAFLLVLISNCVVGQNADPFLKVFPIKITCLEIPLDSIVKVQANELRVSESRNVGESFVTCRSGRDGVSYYVDGIKIKDSDQIEKETPFVLDGNRNRTYSYLDIQRMPKEENLFNSLWLK